MIISILQYYLLFCFQNGSVDESSHELSQIMMSLLGTVYSSHQDTVGIAILGILGHNSPEMMMRS